MLELLDPAIVKSPSRYEARQKAKEYKEVAAVSGDPTHRELANVYKHLSMGHKVISMTKCMELGGVKPNGLPVFAIANAKAKWVWYVYDADRIRDADNQWWHSACAFVSDYSINPGSRRRSATWARKKDVFRFIRFGIRPNNEPKARVPIVPPKILKSLRGHDLANYQILWEADWQQAPRDPMILRRISRDMYIVLAKWDLTEVERLVLERAAFQGE